MTIIDTHQHLWNLDRFQPPWLGEVPPPLSERHTTAEYLEHTDGLDVAGAVYMEADVAPEDQVAEAEWIIGLCESSDHPTRAAVISGRPEHDDFESRVDQFKDYPFIKGFRRVLQVDEVPPGCCLEQRFVRSVQYLGEVGLSYDICIRPRELDDAVKLVEQCPGTRFILDHCGNADPKAFLSADRTGGGEPWHDAELWKRSMAEIAKFDNVVCKISGLVARAPADWAAEDLAEPVNHCLDEFGPDRVVFGSDWPVVRLTASFKRWVAALQEIVRERSEEDQKKLFHDNAVRLYGLTSRFTRA